VVKRILINNYSGKSKNLRDFIEQNGLKYIVVDDSYGTLADKFNIEIFPKN